MVWTIQYGTTIRVVRTNLPKQATEVVIEQYLVTEKRIFVCIPYCMMTKKGLKSMTNLENFRLLKKIIETGESH